MRRRDIDRAKKAILRTRGKFFLAEFEKRTNGEHRRMIARYGVKNHLSGGVLNYNPKDYDLVVVFDMQNMGYRTINLRGLTYLKCGDFVWHQST